LNALSIVTRPGTPGAPAMRGFAVKAGCVALFLMVAVRSILAIRFELPAPVGDGIAFLAPSIFKCRTGFLGSPLTAVGSPNPDGLFPLIWHGYLSPAIYALMNPGCSLRGFYAVHVLVLLFTAYTCIVIGRVAGLTRLSSVALAALAFALQAKVQFRPESLAILEVLWLEWAAMTDRRPAFGALLAALAWTQPTIAVIYAIYAVLARPEALPSTFGRGALAFMLGAGVLGVLYPFPLSDLVGGVAHQARTLVSKNDGEVVRYYLWSNLAPGWGLLLGVVFVAHASKHRRLILLLPVLYWFGFRSPTTVYNLYPIGVALCLGALREVGPWTRAGIATAALVVGIVGQLQMDLRDALTVARYGDTLAQSREVLLRTLQDGEAQIGRLPAIAIAIAPEISIVGALNLGAQPRARTYNAEASRIVEFGMRSGRSDTTCANARSQGESSDQLLVAGIRVFNSQSGWGLEECVRRAE
jgi:hypothetical protein